MLITPETPTRDITVGSVVFVVPQPYVGETGSRGYMLDGKLSEGEAHALNQTFAENARNNFRGLVDEAIEKKEQEENARASESLQAEMDEYIAGYEFGKRTGGVRSVDPVVAAMRELARKIVRKRLRDRGDKLSDYDSEAINKLASEVIERHHDALKAKAEAVVASETALLSDLT